MRTEAQREASRANGAKSRGPKSPEGKAVTKFNGLKHGLRAEQVVLPGEDPAAFEAEKRAWFNDWRPGSHTRAVLVERAAIASWKLRRAVGAESAMRSQRADEAARDFDVERLARVDRAVARFDDDPAGALTLLESDAAGLDRLLVSWSGLEAALARGAAGWDRPEYHARLMLLLGRRSDADPELAGPAPLASARLLAANGVPGGSSGAAGVAPTTAAEAEEAAGALRRAVAGAVDRIRALRQRAPDPEALRRRAVEAAYADISEEAQLRHRYEMAHERSLRATIKQLLALDRSGADLAPPIEADPGPAEASAPQPESQAPDPATGGPATQAPEPSAPGSVGAREPGSIPTPDAAPGRAPTSPSRGAAAAVGGRTSP